MKENNEAKKKDKDQSKDKSFRDRTRVPGQNPKANDDPSHDEHNDQNRRP